MEDDLELDYVAETRIFFMKLQINQIVNDPSPVADADISFKESTTENTNFVRMWPVLRDNLIQMGRINKNTSVPDNLKQLWLVPDAEKIKGFNC